MSKVFLLRKILFFRKAQCVGNKINARGMWWMEQQIFLHSSISHRIILPIRYIDPKNSISCILSQKKMILHRQAGQSSDEMAFSAKENIAHITKIEIILWVIAQEQGNIIKFRHSTGICHKTSTEI